MILRLLCRLIGHRDVPVAGYCVCTRCDWLSKFGTPWARGTVRR